MEAKETDKLFRDKLKNAPSVPKADSWEKLEAMLDKKEKTPVFTMWRVAAAVLILLASSWVVFYWGDESPTVDQVAVMDDARELSKESNVLVEETHEELTVEQKLEVEPLKEVREPETVSEAIKPLEQTLPSVKSKTNEEAYMIAEVAEADELLKIEETQLAEVKVETPEKEDQPVKKKIKSIKITYKRGSKSLPKQDEMIAVQKTDTTEGNKIKELWEQTREIKPGDLWADIRDAKDNLFQKNSKKNNVKNLNK